MTIAFFDYSNWILLGLSALLSAAVWIHYNPHSMAGNGWFPGCFFGLALGVLHLSSYKLLVALAVVSGGAFVLAITLAGFILPFQAFELFVPLSVAQRILNRGITAAAGAVAGAVGALTVSVALKYAAGIGLDAHTEAAQAAVGALCGMLFLQEQPAWVPKWIQSILAFLIWQVPVGIVLGASVAVVPMAERSRWLLLGSVLAATGLTFGATSLHELPSRQRSRKSTELNVHNEMTPKVVSCTGAPTDTSREHEAKTDVKANENEMRNAQRALEENRIGREALMKNLAELPELQEGPFGHFLIESVYAVILVVTVGAWTVVGFAVWLPLLVRTTTILAGSVLYDNLFREQARVLKAQRSVHFAVRFYLRGFQHFIASYRQRGEPDPPVGLFEPLTTMKWKELLVECGWVLVVWSATSFVVHSLIVVLFGF